MDTLKGGCVVKRRLRVFQDFKLDFNHFSQGWKGAAATVMASPGDHVWGVLWRLDMADLPNLDRWGFSVRFIVFFTFFIEHYAACASCMVSRCSTFPTSLGNVLLFLILIRHMQTCMEVSYLIFPRFMVSAWRYNIKRFLLYISSFYLHGRASIYRKQNTNND